MATSKQPRQSQAEGWLPPLSFATLIGVALFVIYIGSAVLSALPLHQSHSYGSVGSLYSRAEEQKYCARQQPNIDTCFHPAARTNRTIYMQPYGGLGNRLRAVASAFTVAREVDARVVIVWLDKEEGFRGRFEDLFEGPRIPVGCFPGGAVREEHARCKVHRVNHVNEWMEVKGRFESVGGREVLCLQSMMFLTDKQRDVGWFYDLLRPVERIEAAIRAFQHKVGWFEWGQWVGVHIRRTDLRLRCNTDNCKDGVKAQDVLPLSKYTDVLEKVATMAQKTGKKPRFYLATDDAVTETHVREELRRAANLTGGEGRQHCQAFILPLFAN